MEAKAARKKLPSPSLMSSSSSVCLGDVAKLLAELPAKRMLPRLPLAGCLKPSAEIGSYRQVDVASQVSASCGRLAQQRSFSTRERG